MKTISVLINELNRDEIWMKIWWNYHWACTYIVQFWYITCNINHMGNFQYTKHRQVQSTYSTPCLCMWSHIAWYLYFQAIFVMLIFDLYITLCVINWTIVGFNRLFCAYQRCLISSFNFLSLDYFTPETCVREAPNCKSGVHGDGLEVCYILYLCLY